MLFARSSQFFESLFEVFDGGEVESLADFGARHEAPFIEVIEVVPRRLVNYTMARLMGRYRITVKRVPNGVAQ